MLPKSRQKQNLQNLENFDKIELILNENNVLLAFNQSEEKSPNQSLSDENYKEDTTESPEKVPVFKCKICFQKFPTKSTCQPKCSAYGSTKPRASENLTTSTTRETTTRISLNLLFSVNKSSTF